jgi:hypothetical protein
MLGVRHQDHDAWLTGKAGRPRTIFCACGRSRKGLMVSGRGDDDASLIEPIEEETVADR